jgi:hypothetical protein
VANSAEALHLLDGLIAGLSQVWMEEDGRTRKINLTVLGGLAKSGCIKRAGFAFNYIGGDLEGSKQRTPGGELSVNRLFLLTPKLPRKLFRKWLIPPYLDLEEMALFLRLTI